MSVVAGRGGGADLRGPFGWSRRSVSLCPRSAALFSSLNFSPFPSLPPPPPRGPRYRGTGRAPEFYAGSRAAFCAVPPEPHDYLAVYEPRRPLPFGSVFTQGSGGCDVPGRIRDNAEEINLGGGGYGLFVVVNRAVGRRVIVR